MIRRLFLAAVILAALFFMLGLLLTAQTVGVEAWHDSGPVPQSAFRVVTPRTAQDASGVSAPQVDVATEEAALGQSGVPHDLTVASPLGSPRVGRGLASLPGPDALRRPASSPVVPSVRHPNVSAGITEPSAGITGFDKAPTATAVSKPSSVSALTGIATWYAYVPGGAAAGPVLRSALGPGWRGRVVRVCAVARCVSATLSDWCACQPPTRLLDLDVRAFSVLADTAMGVIPVEVTWP